MESTGPNRRFGIVMFFTVVFAVGSVGCSDSGDGANGGSGGSAGTGGTPGAENPCLQPNNPACSTATLENGFGEVRIFFDEQRVEAAPDSTIPVFATKGGGASPLYRVSAYEETADCSTDQPGDAFSSVECVPYWNDTFIQAEVGKWFRLIFTESASGNSAPVTMRLTSGGPSAYTLEATWGTYACDTGNGNGGPGSCDGTTVGDGSFESCCQENGDCESNRCCTDSNECDPGNEYTCRRAN